MMNEISPCPFCYDPKREQQPPLEISGNNWNEAYSHWVQCHNCDARGPVADTIIKSIAAWNGAGRWISVDDERPANQEYVLAFGLHRGPTVARTGWHLAYFGTDAHWYTSGGYRLEDVTHWQPLPPPPSSH